MRAEEFGGHSQKGIAGSGRDAHGTHLPTSVHEQFQCSDVVVEGAVPWSNTPVTAFPPGIRAA
jgi:hypothetical protein